MPTTFFKSQFIENHKLNDKFYLLHFKLLDPHFSFNIGQFVIFKVNNSIFRSYSIASLPEKLPFWEMLIDISPQGPGTTRLKNLQKGEIIEHSSAQGIFLLEETGATHHVMVATGCGFASIKPMIETLLRQKKNKVYFFWGLRKQDDIAFLDLLQHWQQQNFNFDYQIILSQPENNWKGKRGYVTPFVIETIQLLPTIKTSIYLCGNNGMIQDLNQALSEVNFPPEQIHFEKYY